MLNHSAALYLWTVLIWGTTWFAIRFQLGVVEPEVSLVYRFALAAAILLVYCRLRRYRLRLDRDGLIFILLQAIFLFSTNYLLFYWATGLLTSGLIAVVFSTVVLMNVFNAALFLKQPVNKRVVAGAVLGLAGITLGFYPEFYKVDPAVVARGLGLSLLATYVASLGNIISARNQRRGLSVVVTNAWGMTFGALIMAAYVALSGAHFIYDLQPGYTISLIFLALFGSVLAFGCYLTLIGRIGADKAGYAAVMFPVVALTLSTFYESYVWTLSAVIGAVLVVLGNILAVSKSRAAKTKQNTVDTVSNITPDMVDNKTAVQAS